MVHFRLRKGPTISLEGDDPTDGEEFILFRHPAYPDERDSNVLLMLCAWDPGLHAQTAILACQIIACNAWNGYLSLTRDAGSRTEIISNDAILTAPEYYFHVPKPATLLTDGPYKYPIYPSFQHWTFPHRQFPTTWGSPRTNVPQQPSDPPSASSVSAAVTGWDGGCILSKSRDYMERAHLCPRGELEWFQANSMSKYNAKKTPTGDLVTDDIANAISLRSDIHHAFDDCKFVIVPKADRWVAHFLQSTNELGHMFHNVPADIARTVKPEFLLARFAWAIFPLVNSFMTQGPKRSVRVLAEKGVEDVDTIWGPDDFSKFASKGRGRSASPKKQKMPDALLPIADQVLAAHNSENIYLPYTQDLAGDSSCDVASGFLPPNPDMSSEDERLSTLRMRELRKRRPSNPDLLCCDYSFAEYANSHGIPGKREHGGAHLCLWCQGAEIDPLEDVPDEPNDVYVKEEAS